MSAPAASVPVEEHSGMEEQSSDRVTIDCDDGSVEGLSRNRLSKASRYFQAMFTDGFTEQKQERVRLHNVSSSDLKCLAEMAQVVTTASPGVQIAQLGESQVLSLLTTAAMLQFDDVRIKCCDHIRDTMSPSNCLLYLAFAEAYSETDLGNLAMKTALWYFQQAAGTSYLIDLPVDLLAKLLDHAYLNVKSELEVFSVIQSWTQGDPETRVEDCCNRLLDTVRWNLLTTQETNVVLESKLTKFGSFKRAVETKIELTVQSSTEAESTQGCKVRKTPLFPCVVGRMRAVKAATMTGLDVPAELIAPLRPCCNKFHQVRPCCKNKAMVSFLFVVKDSNEVEPLMALSKVHGAQGFRVISHGPTVLFTGGEYSLGKSDWNRDVWTYDTIASKWKACAPLETCRRHHSVCVSEERGEAYLVGGYSTHRKRLMRMERVDLRPASRDEVPEDPDLDLPREFKKPSACFFKGKLYVIEEAPIVAYDMGKKSWENVDCSDFPKNIVFNSAVPYKDCIYLTSITGYSLYKFDPESRSIHFVGKFRDETQNICIVGDTIYSFSSDHFDYRSSIETYDIAKAEFKQIWERHTDEIEFAPYEPSGCFPVVLFPEM